MSSSSCSSEYDSYSRRYGSYRSVRAPFYPTMAYPLVYQVQVPSPPRAVKNARKKKTNPNCFVKAFRWYTQEHVPQPQTVGSPQASPDVAGFADWLDSKYEQFLMENQDQIGRRIKLTQTSVIQTESMNNDFCTPCATKRFGRVKSPWKKRCRCATEVLELSNKSLVYLLEPKELPRPGSECCRPTPTACCSETVLVCKKYVVKSQSETNVSKDRNAELPIDIAAMQESPKPQKASKDELKEEISEVMRQESCNIKEQVTKTSLRETPKVECKMTEDSVEIKSNVSKESAGRKITLTQDNNCQCSDESVGTDAHTQYEGSNLEAPTPQLQLQVSNSKPATPTSVDCRCACSELHSTNTQTIIKTSSKKLSIIKTPNTTPKCSKSSSRSNNVSCQCSQEPRSDAQNQYCLACECPSTNKRVCCENRCGVEAPPQQAVNSIVTREKGQSRCSFSCPSRTRALVTESTTRSTCRALISENVQTSDHSIVLDANTIHGYPLFMKIVCADKLYDECMCQKKTLIEEKF